MMIPEEKIEHMNGKIMKIKSLLEELKSDANGFPALARNSERALTSLKMLELNISDLVTFDLIRS